MAELELTFVEEGVTVTVGVIAAMTVTVTVFVPLAVP
jgi:hypothetical protein